MTHFTNYIFHRSEIENKLLLKTRGLQFQDLIDCIIAQGVLTSIPHHNPQYKDQSIMLVLYEGYVYELPCVIEENHIYCITFYPSRKYTKKYLPIS